MKSALSSGPLQCSVCAALMVLATQSLKADATWVYAVQISATVQDSPPQITLNWEPDQFGANSYTVYRKARDATSWGAGTTLPGSALSFTDPNVTVGSTYEYQIIKAGSLGYTGYGYIYSGIQATLVENRGKLVLLVATNSTAGLSFELDRLQTDLIGDGWQVLRHDVSSNDTPASARSLITNDYYADPANLKAVFLFGHVPILQSGSLDYDGHGARPFPADAYYGDMNNDWPTNPPSSPSYLPSDVKLMIGRVDLADMPGSGAVLPWPSEVELLRNYLNKDHNWRFKLINVQRQALMANRFGDENGEAPAASGYRNFEPFVGPGNLVEANIDDAAPPALRWISLVTTGNFLWSYGCGGGQDTSISELGLHGQYNDAWSTDLVGQDAKAVFMMFEGSHFGNWDHADNLLRAVLATPSMGMASFKAGYPHWFCHHMGLGEPIGYSARLSMNNSTLYRNQVSLFTRAIYIALMGDPALRMDPVAPPAGLNAASAPGSVALNWTASPDTVVGYHVYRAATPAGPFSRVTSFLIPGTSFTDTSAVAGTYTYMVRAVSLTTNPSGSYFNPSQGIFVTTTVPNPVPPITLLVSLSTNGLRLTWNSQSGTVYRVQSKTTFSQANWTDQSEGLTATGATASWTDTGISSMPQRFYRIASP